MLRQNLIAERIAVAHYQELIQYFSDHEPTTRRILEQMLEDEEHHAADMRDLLVAQEGKPFLK